MHTANAKSGFTLIEMLACPGAAPGHEGRSQSRLAFTLIEMLVVISIIGLLTTLTATGVGAALERARTAASRSNLRQLALAGVAYAVDHNGDLPPGMSVDNRTRWHGSRTSISAPFDPEGGYLSPYLGHSGRVNRCPLLDRISHVTSFEVGAGGYGYNSTYLGGIWSGGTHRPVVYTRIPQPEQTVFFATTAFANQNGIMEYPFSDPYQSREGYSLQPSTHFRANGKALVAWLDGHVSQESPNQQTGPNYYGGSNQEQFIGWFGPSDQNGSWNPDRE
jgi:prepilin-type N-terminal cleavage/methylation domain-containing protein/prepilin-type processing-associated H-X9-DG protein